MSIECVWDARAELGEGAIWIESEQALYWVDIIKSTLHKFIPSSGEKQTWEHKPNISAVIPTQIHAINSQSVSPVFVATYADGVKLIQDEKTYTLFDPEPELKNNRLNDAYADPYGNLWIGSMHHSIETKTGKFYCVRPDGSHLALPDSYWVTNGPAFDEKNQWIYLVSSKERIILRGKLYSDGHIENLQPWVITKENAGTPDGIAVDSASHLWVTHFGGARVTRYRPDGSIEREIPVPALNTTKCAFGGEDLSTLYITTAKTGMTEQQLQAFPLSGGLFSIKMDGVTGLPAKPYGIKNWPKS